MGKYANAFHDEHDAEISSQTYEQRQQYARYLLIYKLLTYTVRTFVS